MMEATLFQEDVVLERRVQASEQDHRERSRLFLRLEEDGVAGYGEVDPQPYRLNGDPGIVEVRDAIGAALVQLGDLVAREGALPPWTRVARLGNESPPRRVASALVEMAVLDRELRNASRSIDDLWPPRFATPSQSTVSLLDTETPWHIDPASRRVRVKTAPGSLGTVVLERLATLRVPVLLDFNCSANHDDEVLAQVEQARRVCVLAAVEQPYAVGNVVDHARLAARLEVDLSLDEGARSLQDVAHIVRHRAATMICVKPARVGGLANARTIIERARSLGLKVYLGGFFESPYARHVHYALAQSTVEEPSDIGLVDVAHNVDEVSATASSFGLEPSASLLERATALTVLRTGAS
ncbi:MAG: menC [Acidimicrobiaceae bacterium]|nr:menC [Acidimicrobiaceae bacterium]